MKGSVLKTTAVLLILTGTVACVMISCKKENNAQEQVCNVDNPLTDIPWLKQFIDIIEKDVAAGDKQHARIFQCTYDTNKIGFLLEHCVGCPDAGSVFSNCDGTISCYFGGFTGANTCPELNIDFENKKLIWEINNK